MQQNNVWRRLKMINKFFKNIHCTQKDKLIDEIQHEQEMLSRLHVCLGLA